MFLIDRLSDVQMEFWLVDFGEFVPPPAGLLLLNYLGVTYEVPSITSQPEFLSTFRLMSFIEVGRYIHARASWLVATTASAM